MADFEDRQPILEDEDRDSAVKGPGRPLPAICDPKHIAHRVVVLCFMCFLGFGKLLPNKSIERIQMLTAWGRVCWFVS